MSRFHRENPELTIEEVEDYYARLAEKANEIRKYGKNNPKKITELLSSVIDTKEDKIGEK